MTTDSISNSDGYDELTNSPNGVTTSEARDQLKDTLFSAIESGEDTLIDASTSLGKSTQIATTPWREHPEVTGGNLVIHIHQTTDARDEAIEKSKNADGVSCSVLKGREDSCPTAAGDYDDEFTAPQGLDPSEWFALMCDVRKIGFVDAHSLLGKVRDLSCSENGPCPAIKQWWQQLRDDGEPAVDVVHTTANFIHVEDLVEGANLIFDERPSYALTFTDSERQQLRDSLSNLLHYRSNGERAMFDLQTANLRDDPELTEELRALLDEEVGRDWYFRREETHRLAPSIGLAMLDAEEIIPDRWSAKQVNFSGRKMGEHDGVKVVMNSKGKLRHVHYSPNISEARCVVGLDAFPSVYRWQLNTVDDLARVNVLSPEERRLWRREERGLKVVQVGKATRTYTQGWDGAGEERAEGLIHTLRRKHGDEFRTCITAGEIEDDVRRFMTDAGMEPPPPIDGEDVEPTMKYGGQNSRNDFKREVVGLLVGCIDPGDKIILDLLALGGRCAWPEMMTTTEGNEKRKPGRSFEGPATDIASELLKSVREMNLAQAAGRYARNPDSPESSALVYVWSDVCPDSLVDEAIEVTYRSLTDTKESMIEALRAGSQTRSEIQEATGSDKSYIQRCLNSFHQGGLVRKSEETGKDGAIEWEWIGGDPGSTETLVHLDA